MAAFSLCYSNTEADIWNQMISKVQTKYVYIGRNVIRFTWFDRLERLVRQINNINAYVVSSSFRALRSGKVSIVGDSFVLMTLSTL